MSHQRQVIKARDKSVRYGLLVHFPYILVLQDGGRGAWPCMEFYGNITTAARDLYVTIMTVGNNDGSMVILTS